MWPFSREQPEPIKQILSRLRGGFTQRVVIEDYSGWGGAEYYLCPECGREWWHKKRCGVAKAVKEIREELGRLTLSDQTPSH